MNQSLLFIYLFIYQLMHSFQTVHHTHTHTHTHQYGPNKICSHTTELTTTMTFLTDYFNNYNFSKLKEYAS